MRESSGSASEHPARNPDAANCSACAEGICFEHGTGFCVSCLSGFPPGDLRRCTCGSRTCYGCYDVGGCGNPRCDRLAGGE